ALSLIFFRLGFGGLAARAIGFIVRALFSAEEMPLWVSPGSDAGSEASVNQELHQPSRPAAPIDGSASTSSSVEQPAPAGKPYIALLQLEGERKRILDEIVHFVAHKLEDPRQPQGPIYE
ncbi:succinate dehydrogenase subunit 3, partial [Trifolium medium]|nr:succinate dehydrogenase subunit 3 [Trifolium medium]